MKTTDLNKEVIRSEIERVVNEYPEQGTETIWQSPVVGFASASDPLFAELKTAVSGTHAMPNDLLGQARTTVAFFIPFTKALSISNKEGEIASQQWALAYIQTNRLIKEISYHVKAFLVNKGFATHVFPATHNFDEEKLISDWSHRHAAYIAGLGKFGLNNMLITDSGCCGRLGSFITDAQFEADSRSKEEACLYKYNGSCQRCVKRCVNRALRSDEFDRHGCYDMCLANEAHFSSLGQANVCGKCSVAVPCSHTNPVIM